MIITIKDKEFKELIEFIKQNYGIDLSKKKSLIEARLNSILVEKGFNNFREYLNYVYSDTSKQELIILLNKLTTNHTFFMREVQHFNYFKSNILPYLNSSIRDRDIRIWSAGCSSGEEPYTLAMIMEEYFGEDKLLWDKKILATDISANMLKKAIIGIYLSEDVERLSESWKLQFFKKFDNNNYRVSDEIRNQVIFRIFNLMDNFPFKRKFHVIFCRNVMIYFDKETKDKLINKFYDITEKGGYLLIGLSESLNKEDIQYSYVMPSVYRKI